MFLLVVATLVLTFKCVVPNKNALQTNINSKEFENDPSATELVAEDDDYFQVIDPELERVWKRYLKQKKERYIEKLKTSTMMSNIDAVTKHFQTALRTQSFNPYEPITVTDTYKSHINQNVNIRAKPEEIIDKEENYSRITGEIASKKTKETEKFKIEINSTLNETRRQNDKRYDPKKAGKAGKYAKKLRRHTPGRVKEERFREPYWQDGENVFLKTASSTTTTARPWGEKTPSGEETTTSNPMAAIQDCDPSCLLYYKTYGQICGIRYGPPDWKHEYKNFDNLCELDLENCKSPTQRPGWHPQYKGGCGELTEFPPMAYEPSGPLSRKEAWHSYSYAPPTSTLTLPNSDSDY